MPKCTRRTKRLLSAGILGTALVLLSACFPPPQFTISTVLGGLDIPWDIAFTPDGTLLFTERPGDISVLANGQQRVLAHPPDVVVASEAGVMGMAVDPAFAQNRLIYVCLASTNPPGAANDVRVVRFRVNTAYTALSNRTDIVTGMPVNVTGELGRHAGCQLEFGPDGYLWVGTGDSATGSVPQDPTSLGGKVLRVDRNGGAAPGNPGGALDPRIYTYGHRNVQGLAFQEQPGGGFRAFSVEHGTACDDEINILQAGGNYGWNPVPVGGGPGYNESVPMTDTAEFPNAVRAFWSSGCPTIAPSGATFLTRGRWAGWSGSLAVAVLKNTELRVFHLVGDRSLQTIRIEGRGRLRSAVLGPDGDLYLTTSNGTNIDQILRVTPAGLAS